ncbi:MAG TPA: type II toxin-antitoxin system MqsA family antitoxin [Thioploca sp.]|nr:MAG: YgiT-type zinc finger domain-containing protein [Beggiatoa sp. 4572_84]RKZ53851.1 MAG: YgiT-type zinc finger domain-containing protein [Gammaproteobacteria bacterium]HDN26960.1 type II toxin-antitoxin system MqsA family antitoxin [Thioploca sp.]
MKCDLCNEEGINIHLMTKSYGKGENLLVIENVPVMICPHCGESYLTADTLHEIERIKLHRQSFAITRPVAVAGYALPNALNTNLHSNTQQM